MDKLQGDEKDDIEYSDDDLEDDLEDEDELLG
jgi:hypothetical protein